MQAGHTVNTRLVPHRTPIHQTDGRHGAVLLATAARDACVIHTESLGFYTEMLEQWIDHVSLAAREAAFVHAPSVLLPHHSLGYGGQESAGICNLLPGQLRCIEVEHGHIGIGHLHRPGGIEREMAGKTGEPTADIVATRNADKI